MTSSSARGDEGRALRGALEAVFTSPNVSDDNYEPANLVDTSHDIAEAVGSLARAVERLGTNDAATRMGAIEVLAKETKEGAEAIAGALAEVAAAIDRLADAVAERGGA